MCNSAKTAVLVAAGIGIVSALRGADTPTNRILRPDSEPTVVRLDDDRVMAVTSVAQMTTRNLRFPSQEAIAVPFHASLPPKAVDSRGRIVTDGLDLQIQTIERAEQDRIDAPLGAVAPAPVPVVAAPPLVGDFAGTIDNGTSIPPDTMGAVGPNHVAEILNTGFQVFDRNGLVVAPQISLQSFWSALGTAPGQPASIPFDPKILYDQYAGRFVAVTPGNPDNRDGTNNSWLLIAISQTSDPSLGWNLFAIKTNVGGDVNRWADYPGFGLDPNNVTVSFNMFPVGGVGSSRAIVWVINKASLIAAAGPLVVGVDYSLIINPCGHGGFTYQPTHTFGQTAGTAVTYLVNQGWLDNATGTRRFLRLNAITGTGAAAVLSCPPDADWIEVAGYNFNKLGATQLGCGFTIDPLDVRLMNAVWRNGRVWTTHSVGAGTGINPAAPPSIPVVAWYQIDPAQVGPFPGGVPDQQGKVSGGSTAYYDPSIAVNATDCAAIGFSGSGPTTFAGAYYTARFSVDPPNTMQPVSLLKAGEAGYVKTFGSGRNRWGDYSATMVDPNDDLTFWTVQEYAETPFSGVCVDGGGRWGTWWGAFDCGGIVKFSQPADNTGQNITSSLDWSDMTPATVLADDFVSDGRPITAVHWWGGEFAPLAPIDGWMISFHEPLTVGGSASPPLGLYFCDVSAVLQTPTALPSCDANPVVEYEVDLINCCLVHANIDSRSGFVPAQVGLFDEEACFAYDLDIQAVVGVEYVDMSGTCTQVLTGGVAASDIWGWHSTGVESGVQPALQTAVTMSGPNWLYGPWTPLVPSCSSPNMAFELITDIGTIQDCNNNNINDLCEMIDCQPNGTFDACDIIEGTSSDCNSNGVPDECELPGDQDCNGNLVLDECDNAGIAITSIRSAVLGFMDISGTGIALGLADDGFATVTVPFVSAALGTNTVRVSNNGGIGFGSSGALSNPNTPLPSTGAFGGDPSMLVYWTDLDATSGNVYRRTIGSTPSQTFIVQWHNRPEFPGDAVLDGDEGTFQVQIFETPVNGIVAQYLYSDTNFLNPALDNGASATIGYQQSSVSADLWSFDTAGSVTPSVVLSLVKGDSNNTGVPDDCETLPPVGLQWNDDPQATTRSSRSILISATPLIATGGPGASAIGVRMVDLQTPNPPNAECCDAPDFGTYESATCTAIGETNSCIRWLGPTTIVQESQANLALGTIHVSRLQCTPYYTDWTTEGVVSVFGAEIVPSSAYELAAYAVSCKGSEASCTDISAPLQVLTRRSGDVVTLFNPPSSTPQPDGNDVVALVNKFKNLAGAPSKSNGQIFGNLVDLNLDVGGLDISAAVDAFKGLAYPHSGPCVCPSSVTCNATACASAASCSGGLCVKTCIGGVNLDQPCLSNAHCPSSTCGTGFCRDRCGRCN